MPQRSPGDPHTKQLQRGRASADPRQLHPGPDLQAHPQIPHRLLGHTASYHRRGTSTTGATRRSSQVQTEAPGSRHRRYPYSQAQACNNLGRQPPRAGRRRGRSSHLKPKEDQGRPPAQTQAQHQDQGGQLQRQPDQAPHTALQRPPAERKRKAPFEPHQHEVMGHQHQEDHPRGHTPGL